VLGIHYDDITVLPGTPMRAEATLMPPRSARASGPSTQPDPGVPTTPTTFAEGKSITCFSQEKEGGCHRVVYYSVGRFIYPRSELCYRRLPPAQDPDKKIDLDEIAEWARQGLEDV